MARWYNFFSTSERDHPHFHEQIQSLLPSGEVFIPSAIPAREVTYTALRLKYQLEQVVPCELPESRITGPHSDVITADVVKTAKSAGKVSGSDDDYATCVVYCLLVVKHWFTQQAQLELWDADLHQLRASAAEKLAKVIIEEEEDVDYLMQDVLLKRYSILVDDEATKPSNVVEKAVDLHALDVIGSSGYQKCVNYLWRGWLVQDENDPSKFVDYKGKVSTSYWDHFKPDRMRVPQYQNALQVGISFIFLGLYTGAINTINPEGDLDIVEVMLYIFTLGFLCDEFSKFYKIGRYYLGFWNIFNTTLYSLLVVSFVLRMIALGHDIGSGERAHMNMLSYNFLAFSAPMFWMRMLLYLDGFRFFGAMLVVLQVMMKESITFFALLFVVLVGFLQAFAGLDQSTDHELTEVGTIVQQMLNTIMGDPSFDAWDNFGPPFGLILYYIYNFIIIVILLNVLIALYNSAYEDIYSNATDEYLALFALKTIQFVRAPDENVFIAPFNLVEICCLIVPLEWWMPKHTYEQINEVTMGVIYSPLLFVTAFLETRTARKVKFNRSRNESDDDTIEEWEQLAGDLDFEATGWQKRVEESRPNVVVSSVELDLKALRGEVKELKALLEGLKKGAEMGNGS